MLSYDGSVQRLPCAGAVLAAWLSMCACRPVEKARPVNIVLITIDTLRVDGVGCYGLRHVETPNLDRIAEKGVLFENAFAQAPLTMPSHASILTGLYPTAHKVRDTGGFTLDPAHVTLATALQRAQWDTAAFVASAVLKKRFGLNQGFAVYDDDMPAEQRRASEVVDAANRWLGSQSGKPFLLWVHFYDPHLPYDPPEPFRTRYAGQPYYGEIAYVDSEVGRLLDSVNRKSPETIIAVLSDHGEAFSEHGEYAHGIFLYDTTLRIPFLLAGPGVPAGKRLTQTARSIDLLPTLLDLAGVPQVQKVQGVSLTPAFGGRQVPVATYAETLFPKLNMGWSELRSVRVDKWKYIRAPKPELYDVVADPAETQNVAATRPEEVKKLEAQLNSITGGIAEKIEPAAVDSRTLSQLKSLGYLGGSSAREYGTGEKAIDPKDRIQVVKLLFEGMYSDQPQARRVAMLRRAIGMDPANPALYSNLGDLYSQTGNIKDAVQLYQDALQKGVRTAWLYSRMGQLCLRQGKKTDAIVFFEAAARLNPADFESLQNLAAAYRDTGRLADAENTLNAIVKSGESYAPAFNELGMVWYQKGDATTALSYFEKAASLDPTYQLNLARMYKMKGDPARARASFERFLAARGESPEYSAIVPQVKKEMAALP
jgi:arylsulfatase A-like enzyme/Flp pilus assembly protein TadD